MKLKIKEYKNYKALCVENGENIRTGKSKQLHMIEVERFNNIERVGNKIIVHGHKEVVEEKVDGRKNNRGNVKHCIYYEGEVVDVSFRNKMGVYCIVSDTMNIYIGSTMQGFGKRLSYHNTGNIQPHTKKLLSGGATFQILWVADTYDEYIIRCIEQMYIDYFMVNGDYKVVNKRGETICLLEKKEKYKNKIIYVDDRQHDLAMKILKDNGILIGGQNNV